MNYSKYHQAHDAYRISLNQNNFLGGLVNLINDHLNEFSIQVKDGSSNYYFPDFLSSRLDNFCLFFESTLKPFISRMPISSRNPVSKVLESWDVQIGKDILKLPEALKAIVNLYYLGRVNEASKTLEVILKEVFIKQIGMNQELYIINSIPAKQNFYRARPNGEKPFERLELFHHNFENRHLVSTNRYSIPGVPALYLGSDPVICNMELNTPGFDNLSFSRLENNIPLNVLNIQRVEDAVFSVLRPNYNFLNKGNDIVAAYCAEYICNYISSFPLIIACTCLVKKPEGNFKPEYIIPQLLLQNVLNESKIDGIKYPSTKVVYPEGCSVDLSYNYVFPVKTTKKVGLCDRLSQMFNITEPTSLKLHDILNEHLDEQNQYNDLRDIIYPLWKILDNKPALSIS
ncbi:hypothetical protein [Adhaeribacter aquaticus]|uniref:hypothetical protein n=1 Tax=Adhaeribacter aquaticus TaxID=299567 RepID=UPI0003F9F265|nr:hypothetical protein [Adhaeribacter aquaticus]